LPFREALYEECQLICTSVTHNPYPRYFTLHLTFRSQSPHTSRVPYLPPLSHFLPPPPEFGEFSAPHDGGVAGVRSQQSSSGSLSTHHALPPALSMLLSSFRSPSSQRPPNPPPPQAAMPFQCPNCTFSARKRWFPFSGIILSSYGAVPRCLDSGTRIPPPPFNPLPFPAPQPLPLSLSCPALMLFTITVSRPPGRHQTPSTAPRQLSLPSAPPNT